MPFNKYLLTQNILDLKFQSNVSMQNDYIKAYIIMNLLTVRKPYLNHFYTNVQTFKD